MMSDAIQISNLQKSYGSHVVLNGLNFCVQQGEIFALPQHDHYCFHIRNQKLR